MALCKLDDVEAGHAARTKPSDLLVTRAASATMRLARSGRDGGVCEMRLDRAVGRAAGCSSLTLLVAGECTIARVSIVIAMQAISILASCDQGSARCQDGRRRRQGQKERTHLFLPRWSAPLDGGTKRAGSM